MTGATLVDITEIAKGWFNFLYEEVCLDDFNYELACTIFNEDFVDMELFIVDLYQKGVLTDGRFDNSRYLYDYIYENVLEHLIDPINRLLGRRAILLNVKVLVVRREVESVLAIFT